MAPPSYTESDLSPGWVWGKWQCLARGQSCTIQLIAIGYFQDSRLARGSKAGHRRKPNGLMFKIRSLKKHVWGPLRISQCFPSAGREEVPLEMEAEPCSSRKKKITSSSSPKWLSLFIPSKSNESQHGWSMSYGAGAEPCASTDLFMRLQVELLLPSSGRWGNRGLPGAAEP